MSQVMRALVGAGALLTALWAAAPTATATDGESEGSARTLAGHRYLTTNLLADPFITSHLKTRLGYGLAFDLKSPLVEEKSDELMISEVIKMIGTLPAYGKDVDLKQQKNDQAGCSCQSSCP